MRALNLRLLAHGSVQANTHPERPCRRSRRGGAVGLFGGACGGSGGSSSLAAGITVATVLGRYHYAVDSILGVLVAMACWLALGR